jgi:hypothetical protein
MNAQMLLLAHAGATLFMTGLIWFVQVVHYPLFARVGAAGYTTYQREHMDRTGRVVGPAMLLEAAAAAALLWLRPTAVPAWMVWTGIGLLAAIWISTALVQAPTHGRLAAGWDSTLGNRLVGSNWFRTVAWSVRSFIALAMIAAIL